MAFLVWFSPGVPMDPWHLFNPKKVASMIFALTLIQVMGAALASALGTKGGSILTGFLGGLISSTATTASLAKRSKSDHRHGASTEILTFLAATVAMLFEGFALLLSGTREFHFGLSLIFFGPILLTGFLIYRHSSKLENRPLTIDPEPFRLLPILKLGVFILLVLALSKVLQNMFGQAGLVALTFLVSLFEIHGSIIANVQLHETGQAGVRLLGNLLAVSIFASYLSKLLLISTPGSQSLKAEATKSTLFLLMSLLLSWWISVIAL